MSIQAWLDLNGIFCDIIIKKYLGQNVMFNDLHL